MADMRVGMLGAGFIGSFHSYALKLQPLVKTPPAVNVTLAKLADIDPTAREVVRRRFGWEATTDSWQNVIEDSSIGIFINAGPNNLHAEPTVAAAQAGKHVFCEKPLARDAEEAFRIWQSICRTGVVHQAAFVYRFVPAVRYMREIIRSGAIGQINNFRSNYLMSNYLQPGLEFSWRLDKNVAGTGTFGDLGAHHIDAARFLLGEIEEVAAIARTFVPKIGGKLVEVDDAFVSVVQFQSGAIGTIEASRVAGGYGHTSRFQLDGTKGSVRFDVERLNQIEIADGLAAGFRTVQVVQEQHPFADFWWEGGVQGSHPIGWIECFVHQMHHFLNAVTGAGQVAPFAATFEDGYRAAEIADAMIRSWQSASRERVTYRSAAS